MLSAFGVTGRDFTSCALGTTASNAALTGWGIAYTVEALVEPFLRSGQLVRVLEDWSPTFQGLYLYCPAHRRVPATLRALIDMIRTAGYPPPARRSPKNPFAKGLFVRR